jgi:hypothetical protein
MLTSLLQAVGRCFCAHEWIARTDSTRLYVECVKCLATSDGIELRRTRTSVPVRSIPVEPQRVPSNPLAA